MVASPTPNASSVASVSAPRSARYAPSASGTRRARPSSTAVRGPRASAGPSDPRASASRTFLLGDLAQAGAVAARSTARCAPSRRNRSSTSWMIEPRSRGESCKISSGRSTGSTCRTCRMKYACGQPAHSSRRVGDTERSLPVRLSGREPRTEAREVAVEPREVAARARAIVSARPRATSASAPTQASPAERAAHTELVSRRRELDTGEPVDVRRNGVTIGRDAARPRCRQETATARARCCGADRRAAW